MPNIEFKALLVYAILVTSWSNNVKYKPLTTSLSAQLTTQGTKITFKQFYSTIEKISDENECLKYKHAMMCLNMYL